MTSPDPNLPQLWQRLRSMFARASSVIAALPALAVITTLTHTRRYEIACWIARLESIARKLLFAEASQLQHSSSFRGVATRRTLNPGATAAPIAAGLRIALSRVRNNESCERKTAFDPAHPHTWPARFKLTPPRDPLAVPESRAPRIRALWGATPAPEPSRTIARDTEQRPAALRLALRFEALRRVLENPLPHAQRLARIFHRISRRYPEAASRYAIAGARPHAADPGDPRLIIDALCVAMAAVQFFANTS